VSERVRERERERERERGVEGKGGGYRFIFYRGTCVPVPVICRRWLPKIRNAVNDCVFSAYVRACMRACMGLCVHEHTRHACASAPCAMYACAYVHSHLERSFFVIERDAYDSPNVGFWEKVRNDHLR
jgi:hypothetical protein